MNRRALFRSGSALGIAAVAGCLDALESDPPVEDVEMEITDLRAPETGLTSATVPVRLRIENTADEAVPRPAVDYTVALNGEDVGTARETVGSLDGGEGTTITLEVDVDYADLGSGIVDAIESGDLHVELTGEIESDGAAAGFSTDYSY